MVFPPGTLSCSSQNPINLSHPHVAIFFSPVFFFFFFHSLYSSANCAIKRANSGVCASGQQQQQNHKKKLSRLVSLVRKRANKCPITKGYSMDYLI